MNDPRWKKDGAPDSIYMGDIEHCESCDEDTEHAEGRCVECGCKRRRPKLFDALLGRGTSAALNTLKKEGLLD